MTESRGLSRRVRTLLDSREFQAVAARGRADVQPLLAEVRTLVRLVDAYRKGEYRDIDTKDVAKIVAGLVYLVMPVDVVPDFLGPAVGFADDLVLLRWLLRTVRTEIRRFEAWEGRKGT